MIEAWIVIREEKHLNNKYWVCLNEIDALRIADEVSEYWKKEYDTWKEYDTKLYGDLIFNCTEESQSLFSVQVQPQIINESGEYLQDGIYNK